MILRKRGTSIEKGMIFRMVPTLKLKMWARQTIYQRDGNPRTAHRHGIFPLIFKPVSVQITLWADLAGM